MKSIQRVISLLLTFSTLIVSTAASQTLEPRFLSPAPKGMNFLLLSYGYSVGDVLLDPSLPIEGANAKIHSGIAGYFRSIAVLGLSGRATLIVPAAYAKWQGTVGGIDSTRTQTGLGDPEIGFALNFIGAPALEGAEFARFQPGTILGGGFRVRIPVGTYDSTKLANLGSNRWAFGPILGLSTRFKRFTFEGYGTAWFFTENENFGGVNTLNQEPMLSGQLHIIYSFRRGFWGAVSFGQNWGGETKVNGVEKNNEQTNNRFGATLALPINFHNTLKLAYTSGLSIRAGSDFDTFFAAWQFRWGGMPKRPLSQPPEGSAGT